LLNYELNSREKEYELLDNEFHGDGTGVNPFPGLRPFGVDECHLFFGRESHVDAFNLLLKDSFFSDTKLIKKM